MYSVCLLCFILLVSTKAKSYEAKKHIYNINIHKICVLLSGFPIGFFLVGVKNIYCIFMCSAL